MSPFDTKHPCSYPQCSNLVESRSGSRCPAHPYKRAMTAEYHSLYSTSKWKRMRKYHLHKNSVCVVCGTEYDLQVDHVKDHKGDPELFYNWDNLQTLCMTHHSQKTGRDHGGK